jgi:hypothetical protein
MNGVQILFVELADFPRVKSGAFGFAENPFARDDGSEWELTVEYLS